MNAYAIVQNGVVSNIIAWDGNAESWSPPAGAAVVDLLDGDVASIGYAYSDGSFVAPATAPPSLSDAQAAQNASVDVAYASAVTASVSFKTASGITQTFQADSESQTVLMQAVQGYQIAGGVPAGFFWKAADNTLVPFTLADVEGLYTTILAQGWAAFQRRTALKQQIAAATTVSGVTAVVW